MDSEQIVMTFIWAAILGIIPAVIAKNKGYSFWSWWFFGAGMFIVALPMAIMLQSTKEELEKQETERGHVKCTYCAEYVKPEAIVCKHCGRDLPQESAIDEAAGNDVFNFDPTSDENQRVIEGVEFIRIPKSIFLMGSKDNNKFANNDERPQQSINLAYDFWMARYPLTNKQYVQYLRDQQQTIPTQKNKEDHPVVNVSWNNAMAYCKWFNTKFKSELGDLILRLPSEAEWEKAARGAYANEWPWGNEFDAKKCNSAEGREGGKKDITPVGLYSAAGGDSPYGCTDMVGNIWEWTHSLFMKYPYAMKDGREEESSRDRRVMRGGSFDSDLSHARCASRRANLPDGRGYYYGFRVCASSPSHI